MFFWTSIIIFAVSSHNAVHALFFGKPVKIEEYPFMAALICKNRDGKDYNCCSGVIITEGFVLTTGYCVNPEKPHFQYSKQLVGVRVGSTSAMGGGELHNVSEIRIRGIHDTLALVGVEKPFVWSETVGFAYLPAMDAPDPRWLETCKYLGWGSGNEEVSFTVDGMRLGYTDVTFLSMLSCKDDGELESFREYDMYCTTSHAGDNSAINGTAAYSQDRGAPLICDYMVYGLVQVIKDNIATLGYMGHINVHKFVDWIDDLLDKRDDSIEN